MYSSPFPSSQEYYREHYLISTDIAKIDVGMVHNFLANESYWAAGIGRETVERLLKCALCYGLYDSSGDALSQIGFARVITDFASFAYLSDVFILSGHRGRGLGKWLISSILAHPDLQNLRKWMLNTKDAHSLYERFGFQLNTEQETYMTYRPHKLKQREAPA